MNETVTLTDDGILVLTTTGEDYKKVVRYFDSSRQMLLDVLEETGEKKILTKYQSDGFRVQCIEVTKKNQFIRYKPDGKTRLFQRDILPNGSVQSVTFQEDGQTFERVTIEDISGCVLTTKYQSDGQTPTMLIESDFDGLTKMTTYANDGIRVLSVQEDLADGTVQTTYFRENGTREKVILKHLKGLPQGTIREADFDEKGLKIVQTKDVVAS